ncbi:MAG: signal peptidase I [Burkholderiales bacterium]
MNFALIMLIALIVTGGIWLLDHYTTKPKRAADAKEPLVVEYAKSFFPVILVVFLLRSFVVEPFKIPSGSMMPTLLIGDFILVNKYTYGIRLPVVNRKIVNMGAPQRGDVMVFRFPEDPSLDYIKRVVALPGDHVEYRSKRLLINGAPIKTENGGVYRYIKGGMQPVDATLMKEQLEDHRYQVLVQPVQPAVRVMEVRVFPNRENCDYDEEGFGCLVPAQHYFVMGDNRDDSNDSRYWGFVPEQNIVGKAFYIWWNFNDFERIRTVIN